MAIADGLQSNGSTFGQALQEALDGAGLVIDTRLLAELAILVKTRELRVTLAQP